MLAAVRESGLDRFIETPNIVSMEQYKRNQVEAAISAAFEREGNAPSDLLRTRIKRLLDADRALGRRPRSIDDEERQYAFFSSDPGGSGNEYWFSAYEAFALLLGLYLLNHNWSQSFAVSILRHTRTSLEKEHVRILGQDPKQLFDEAEIQRNARPGDMAFNNIDPVLLTIVSKPNFEEQNEKPIACAVCRGHDAAMKFAYAQITKGGGFTMFDIVGSAHVLAGHLRATEPNSRGRRS